MRLALRLRAPRHSAPFVTSADQSEPQRANLGGVADPSLGWPRYLPTDDRCSRCGASVEHIAHLFAGQSSMPNQRACQIHHAAKLTAVEERLRARMPMRDEIEALNIPGGVPVLTITRRMFAGERVVEVAHDIVLPADRTELEYRIELQES
jgi:hypothetical protein